MRSVALPQRVRPDDGARRSMSAHARHELRGLEWLRQEIVRAGGREAAQRLIGHVSGHEQHLDAIGVEATGALALINSGPLSPGRLTSTTTKSGGLRPISASASSASAAS